MAAPSPGAFMKTAPRPVNSNSAWGSQYAMTLRQVVINHAAHAPRTLQKSLGPSELGTLCDRQVAGKLAGIPATNHVVDPWASIMGTAGHAWMADAFTAENRRTGISRWLAEFRVYPDDKHPGTGDLYDFLELAVTDHKFLGDTPREKLIKDGPPRRYRVQLLKYGKGFRRLGLEVRRVVLVAWPRTRSTMAQTYVWDHPWSPEDDELLAEVDQQHELREIMGAAILSGRMGLRDVPATPDDDDCYFCPFFRAEAAHDSTAVGCPGHHLLPGRSNITGP